jgi:hypothetical protein
MSTRFGSLLRLLFVWKIFDVKPDEIMQNRPDCILMQAFGQAWSYRGPSLRVIVPGPANEEIANVMTLSERGTLSPVVAQWEFSETHAAKRGELKVQKILGSREDYRNTREILQEAKEYMDQRGWKTAVIVGHPWHLARCIWTAQKLGIQVVNDQWLVQDLNADANVWNNRVDVPDNQRQTKSLWHWLPYEFMARGYSWWHNWI